MKKVTLLSLALSFAFAGVSFAQGPRCGTMTLDSIRRANNPAMGSLDDWENWFQQEAAKQKKAFNPNPQLTAYVLPVIVHVIHNGENVGVGRNISQAQILSQIDVMNKDFRGWNADVTNVPTVWKPLVGDMAVNFCMATKDPQGNTLAEPGIDRVNRNSKGWPLSPYDIAWIDQNIKPATIWDPNKYLNIWITQPYDANNMSVVILGYATWPPGSSVSGLTGPYGSATTDGIVIKHTAFGTTGSAQAPSNKGRTTTHELGHWMGMRHIWGDGTCQSDYVTDTPIACDANFVCPTFPYVSCCANGPNGDMFMNYMDYTDDACKCLFTKGQATRAGQVFTSSPMRIALTQSNVACGYGVSVQERSLESAVSVYPNPSSGLVNIDIAMEKPTDMTISVYNVLGSLVTSLQPASITSESLKIDLSTQPPGVYFVEVRTATQSVNHKIVLNKN